MLGCAVTTTAGAIMVTTTATTVVATATAATTTAGTKNIKITGINNVEEVQMHFRFVLAKTASSSEEFSYHPEEIIFSAYFRRYEKCRS